MLWILGFIPGAGPAVFYLRDHPAVRQAVEGLLTVLICIGLVWGVYNLGKRDQRLKDETKAAAAVAEARARNTLAVAKADAQRTADNAATAALEKDLTHAYDKTPDSRPSAARLALACARVQHDRPGSKLPAACRPSI